MRDKDFAARFRTCSAFSYKSVHKFVVVLLVLLPTLVPSSGITSPPWSTPMAASAAQRSPGRPTTSSAARTTLTPS